MAGSASRPFTAAAATNNTEDVQQQMNIPNTPAAVADRQAAVADRQAAVSIRQVVVIDRQLPELIDQLATPKTSSIVSVEESHGHGHGHAHAPMKVPHPIKEHDMSGAKNLGSSMAAAWQPQVPGSGSSMAAAESAQYERPFMTRIQTRTPSPVQDEAEAKRLQLHEGQHCQL
jgi:hypothetical protein